MNAITPRMRFDVVGREIARAALYLATARVGKRDRDAMAPTLERFAHGQTIERYDGAVVEAGAMGHRVVDACLLDRLRERGIFGRGEKALLRHSAGLWLRGLFHDSGAVRAVTMRLEYFEATGSGPARTTVFERSQAASVAYARFQAAMDAMAWREFYGAGAAMGMAQKKRAAQAVREIACWDRLPAGFGVAEIRAAFDRLVLVMERVGVVGEEG
jgi:hypothetical protein